MGLLSDLKVLYHIVLRPVRGKTHEQRLESFYGGQAEAYDDFRKRLLQGREDVYKRIGQDNSGVWVDFGGGTGANLEFIGEPISKFSSVYVVDLSSSLLNVASKRANERGWTQVKPTHADATTWQPPEGTADVVTFSYSLTMIPDWFAAIENAMRILKPGGVIGVVDFYVSRKFPNENLKKHGWLTRTFWPVWFASDNVFPSVDHVPFLQRKFETVLLNECKGKIPYFPLLKMPYYQFIGRKPAAS
jgi:S-adenosylmethionine-diacylgycerolhomoserine-N-methlytransferase